MKKKIEDRNRIVESVAKSMLNLYVGESMREETFYETLIFLTQSRKLLAAWRKAGE